MLGFGRAELKVEEAAIALTLSAAICALGTTMAKSLNINGGGIPCITAIVVLLATVFPSFVGSLGSSAEGLAVILLQVRPCSQAPRCHESKLCMPMTSKC